MTFAFWLFQAWMVLCDWVGLRATRRWPRPWIFALVVVSGGAAIIVGASLCMGLHRRGGGSMFTFLGLVASGLFVHGPVVLFGGWWLLRRTSPRFGWFVLANAVILSVIVLDAFAIEPTWLEVTRHEIASPKLTRPVKIVVVADFQAEAIGRYERRVLETIRAEAPDLVLLPGDYIHEPDSDVYAERLAELNAHLRDLEVSTPLGWHAVRGNVEGYEWPEAFDGLNAEIYQKTRTTQRGELSITGLSFGDSFDLDVEIEGRPGFHIVFGHAPNFALGEVQADLLIAGHTHGGQVRLPLFGPIITLSRVPRSWAAGRTELEGGRTLYVSRGIGMERGYAPRMRFLCRPELVVLELVPESGER